MENIEIIDFRMSRESRGQEERTWPECDITCELVLYAGIMNTATLQLESGIDV